MTPTARRIAAWTLTALATFSAVFILPYRFPLRTPVLSDTWTAGANNQVAALAVAAISLLVTLVLWRSKETGHSERSPASLRRTESKNPETVSLLATAVPLTHEFLPPRLLPLAIFAALLWTTLLGVAVTRAHIYWGDAGFFLNQLRTGLVFHQPLYTGFEFPYGPALYGWPAVFIKVLAPLGVSPTAAYLASLAVMQAAGLALLFYVVDSLPMRRSLKTAAFVLITLGSLNSLLGLNYSVFRFILPLASVVLLTRQRALASAALVAALATLASFLVSPELGIAFALAALALALFSAFNGRSKELLPAAATLASAALFALIAGPAYFGTMRRMAHGGFNLLLSPTPHIVVFLVAAVALAPLAVASALRRRDVATPLLLGLYAVALALLPAALGRCDPIHVFSDGLGFYLLSFVTLDRAAAPRTRALWIAAVALVFALTQLSNLALYSYRLKMVLGIARLAPSEGVDETKLLAAIGTAKISAPKLAPPLVLDDLTRRGQYVPGFFSGWTGVWDSASERRVIADMRRTPYALVAFTDPPAPDPKSDLRIARLMRLGLAHHPPRPPWIRGALLDAELAAHWTPLGIFGDFVLFRQNP